MVSDGRSSHATFAVSGAYVGARRLAGIVHGRKYEHAAPEISRPWRQKPRHGGTKRATNAQRGESQGTGSIGAPSLNRAKNTAVPFGSASVPARPMICPAFTRSPSAMYVIEKLE